MESIQYIMLSGKNEAKILLPSSGGMGTKLNVPKTMLIKAAKPKIGPEIWLVRPNLITPKNKIANKKLLSGPAKATSAIPNLRGLKAEKSTGTGLAAPKIMGEPTANNKSGNKIEPNGSMCGKGFRVILPWSLAVLSPNFSAISPWLTSWTMAENIKITKVAIIFILAHFNII